MKTLDHDCEEVSFRSIQGHSFSSYTSKHLAILREMGLSIWMVRVLHNVSRDRRALPEYQRFRISRRALNHADATQAEVAYGTLTNRLPSLELKLTWNTFL